MNRQHHLARIEPLEPRQLLSASPFKSPVPAPSLLGSFLGHTASSAGSVLLQLNIQSQKGLATSGSSLQGDGKIGHLAGNISRKQLVRLTLKGTSGKFVTKWTGQLTGDTLTGTFVTTIPRQPRETGTFSVTRVTDTAVASGPLLNTTNGHFYFLLQPGTWADAQTTAQSLGGNLVTINDAAEQSFVYNNFATNGGVGRNIWLGYHDPAHDALTGPAHAANFVWVDGSTPAYTNWNTGEPNNFNHAQFFAYVMAPHWGTNGLWDDNEGTGLVDRFGAQSQGVVEIGS
jgi:hypothetical protein